RRRHPGRAWHDIDLETIRPEQLEGLVDANSVIICSDVIEHLSDPGPLARTLAQYADVAAAVVVSTPERPLTRGDADRGPPANPCHVREGAFDELKNYLQRCGFPAFAFYGLTRSNSLRDEWHTLISISSTRDIGALLGRITNVERVGAREYPVLDRLYGIAPAMIGRGSATRNVNAPSANAGVSTTERAAVASREVLLQTNTIAPTINAHGATTIVNGP